MAATRTIGILTRQFEGNFITELLHIVQRSAKERGYLLLAVGCEPAEIARTGLAQQYVSGWLAFNWLDGVELLVVRGSSYVQAVAAGTQTVGVVDTVADWQQRLIRSLLHHVSSSTIRAADSQPESIWPGVRPLPKGWMLRSVAAQRQTSRSNSGKQPSYGRVVATHSLT